jgi:hypothetical protein
MSAARTGLQAEIDRLKFEIERLKTVQTEQTVVFDKSLYLAELQPTTAKFEAKDDHVDHVDDLKEHTLRLKPDKPSNLHFYSTIGLFLTCDS